MPADTQMHIPDKRTLEQKLQQKILTYYQTIWQDAYIKGYTHTKWLENFKDNDEDIQEQQRLEMLYLLSKFLYFGHSQIRELLRALFRDLVKYPIIEQIRREHGDTQDLCYINSRFGEELNKTRFLGVGNPSESGIHLLYYLRQECNLKKDLFINTSDILAMNEKNRYDAGENQETHKAKKQRYWVSELREPQVKRYVFIDDFCGSGSQVKNYLQKYLHPLKAEYPNIEISYLMLFGTEEGIKNVKASNMFNRVEAVFTLGETFKAFGSESRYFKNMPKEKEIDQEQVKNTAQKYGNKLNSIPLGYKDGQLLIGFFHNTPDNTLPIFWAESENWHPVFKRYGKNY